MARVGQQRHKKKTFCRRNITTLWTSAMLQHILYYAVFLTLGHRISNVKFMKY